MTRRTSRLNSLLKEVLSEVIARDVRNPKVSALTTVASVDISKDLRHAKVYVSIIGDQKVRDETLKALQSAASFIAITASKKVVMRYFPSLNFKLDTTADSHEHIDELLKKIDDEKSQRPSSN